MAKLFGLGQLNSDELEKGIVEGADKSKPLESRDLSWDRVVFFLSGLLLGLASLDLFSALLQDKNGVACDLSPYSDVITDESFILSVCERSVPVNQFFPAIILAQALLILFPHFFWKSQFSGHFASFFDRVKGLEQNSGVGLYSYRNKNIIRKMKTTFVTYNKSFIFFWYKVKLAGQLLFIAASVVIVLTVDELTNFDDTFNCTQQDGIDWPLGNASATCIFTSIRLFQLIFILDLILLVAMFPILLWGLIWCFKRHPSVLGSKSIAKFSFSIGLPQELYIPKPVFSGLAGQWYKVGREYFKELRNRFELPNIVNDFDFLVILLSSVDIGLGNTFREGEVILELERLYQNDQQELNAHVHYHKVREDYGVRQYDNPSTLGWQFMNEVYDKGFRSVDLEQKLVIPRNIRGAVVGYGLLCEGVKYSASGNTKIPLAVEVTFGSPGFALSLARVFGKVFSINFDPGFHLESEAADDGEDQPAVLVTHNPTRSVTTIRCPENIYTNATEENVHSQEKKTSSQKRLSEFNKALEQITAMIDRPKTVIGTRKIEFVLINPIMFQKHSRVVEHFLRHLEQHLNQGTILLTLKLAQIEDYDIQDLFHDFSPQDMLFDGKCIEPIEPDVELSGEVLRWLPTDEPEPANARNKKNPHFHQLQCGESTCTVQMAAYCINKSE